MLDECPISRLWALASFVPRRASTAVTRHHHSDSGSRSYTVAAAFITHTSTRLPGGKWNSNIFPEEGFQKEKTVVGGIFDVQNKVLD